MLYRFLSGEDLPEDFDGSKNAPEVVIRQIGKEDFQVWDIKKARVLNCLHMSGHSLLSSFDPDKSFYMFEPSASIREPYFYEFSTPTMISASTDIRRFKEFQKHGGVKLYMPTWNLEELQAVRKYAQDHCPEKFSLTSKDVESRFKEFGGNFRHIFARDITYFRKDQDMAIAYLEIFPFYGNEEQRVIFLDVCELLAKYRVHIEGPDSFKKAGVELMSEQVEQKIRKRFSDSDANRKIEYLKLMMP